MFPFGSLDKPIVGLDIGTSAIKAVELRGSGRKWSLHRIGWKALPPKAVTGGKVKDKEVVVQALRELWTEARIGCKRVAIGVGGQSVILKRIPLALMSEMDLEDQLALEAEEHIPFDIEEVYLDFQILERGAEQMEVLLAACKKELVDNRLEATREAGLNPVLCDLDLFSMANAYDIFSAVGDGQVKHKNTGKSKTTAAPPEKGEKIPATALVNAGASHLSVAILVNGLPESTRDHAFGGERLLQELQQNASCSFEEADRMIRLGTDTQGRPWSAESRDPLVQAFLEQMGTLIRQSMDFHLAGHPNQQITSVQVGGGCAPLAELPDTLESLLNLPVRVITPWSGLHGSLPPQLDPKNAPGYLVALGLALRGDAP
ncbi:MAG: type IV pilus assembly protein PilM [Magnetococcales bacterium]|nr:type IV pilus assembly protein PilM [Magnetococcales bacterium]